MASSQFLARAEALQEQTGGQCQSRAVTRREVLRTRRERLVVTVLTLFDLLIRVIIHVRTINDNDTSEYISISIQASTLTWETPQLT